MLRSRPVLNAARRSEASPGDWAERVARAWRRHPIGSFVRHRRTLAWYRQLHAFFVAGTPLPTAFERMATFAPDERTARALGVVSSRLQAGASLSDALAGQAEALDDVALELIAFGEEAGTLEAVTAAIIEHLEAAQALRWRTVMLFAWPAYLGASVLFVGPLLEVARAVHPGDSLGGLYLHTWVRIAAWAVALIAGPLAVPLLLAAAGWGAAWERFLRGLPLVSKALQDHLSARFVMVLGLGTAAGMEVHRTLRAAVRATGSPACAAALPAVEAALRSGSSLVEAVAQLQLVDRTVLGALAVADSTGTLDERLGSLSRDLQDSALRRTQTLVVLLSVSVAAALIVWIALAIFGVGMAQLQRIDDAVGHDMGGF